MFYHKNIVSHLIINPQTKDGSFVDETKPSQRIVGTQLYGILESYNCFDIFGIAGNLPTSTGIYPAKVLGRPETDNEATFFLWVDADNRTRGIVVLNREENEYLFALEQYRKRSKYI